MALEEKNLAFRGSTKYVLIRLKIIKIGRNRSLFLVGSYQRRKPPPLTPFKHDELGAFPAQRARLLFRVQKQKHTRCTRSMLHLWPTYVTTLHNKGVWFIFLQKHICFAPIRPRVTYIYVCKHTTIIAAMFLFCLFFFQRRFRRETKTRTDIMFLLFFENPPVSIEGNGLSGRLCRTICVHCFVTKTTPINIRDFLPDAHKLWPDPELVVIHSNFYLWKSTTRLVYGVKIETKIKKVTKKWKKK